jgi:hypothetical protein
MFLFIGHLYIVAYPSYLKVGRRVWHFARK